MIGVRDARPDDLDRLSDLVGQLWEAHGDTDLDPARTGPRAAFLLDHCDVRMFTRDDRVIGYAALYDMGDLMFVRHFVIDRAVRGSGTGRAAYEVLARTCFPGRAVRLDASVKISQPRAFWEAMGFSAIGWVMESRGEAA